MKRLTGLFLIFMSGFATGIICHGLFMHMMMRKMHSGPPEKRVDFIVSDLTKQLGLDQQQQVKVRLIISNSDIKINALRDSFSPKIKEVMDDTFNLIEKELSENQKKKLKDIRKRMRHPPGCGGPPPPPL